MPLRLLTLLWVLTIVGCASSPPSNIDNICTIFAQKKSWHKAARRSQQRWNTPIPVMMAIMRHESSFQAKAKPARKRILGFIPGARPSDAYGYPQALKSTWKGYQQATDQRGADRDDFADAIDFIGWYNDQSWRRNGIDKTDTYRLYLAYHEGHGGYSRGSYRNKSWLQNTAKRVAGTSQRYEIQLRSCV